MLSSEQEHIALGIDVGGTGIKAAPVDVSAGKLVAERLRVLTPQPATPKAVSATVTEIVNYFRWDGPIGCGFPAAIRLGKVKIAANVSKKWIDKDIETLFANAAARPVTVLNDADAAGLAEMRFGAGREQKGTVIVITLGTGIGTGLFVDGHLVPNTELGHIDIGGRDAESLAAAIVREKKKLSWKEWSEGLDKYLAKIQFFVWPDLIILGGGVSKKHEKFIPHLSVDAKIVPAQMLNQAGIVGAAAATLGL